MGAAQNATMVDRVVVATTDQTSDQPIAQWCQDNGIDVFRGDKKMFSSAIMTRPKAIKQTLSCVSPQIVPY